MPPDMSTIYERIDKDFEHARWRAFFHRVWSALRRRPATLLPFDEVRSRFFIRGQYDRGIQAVPLSKIVGSQGRANDFDRLFRPASEATAARWKSIDRAHYLDVSLPAVELYKIGDIYFVSDGNHRVSVARLQGRQDIDAHVIELKVDVPLDSDLELRDLVRKEEQSDFFEWTNLGQVRPDNRIEVSNLGGYLDLIAHINRQRAMLSCERDGEVSTEEAIASWYDSVYQPVVSAIRRAGLLRAFRRRTETDLYIAVMNHRERLMAQTGSVVTADDAAADYLARFGPWTARVFKRRRRFSGDA